MKTLKSKLTLVLTFLAVIMLSLGFVFMPRTANALLDTSSGFYIENGASIRFVAGENGIKWTAHLTKDAYDKILKDNGVTQISEIGISIIPTVAVGTELDHTDEYTGGVRREYRYQGDLSKIFDKDPNEFVYTWAVFYDELLEDMHKAGIFEGTDELISKAYDMSLEATPYVKVGGRLEGDKLVDYGEPIYGVKDDTSRSLRGVALSHLIDGDYANDTAKETILKSYFNGEFEYVDNIKNKSEGFNYYSAYDNVGLVVIPDQIPLDASSKVYLGAREITNVMVDIETKMFDLENRTVNLANIDGVAGETYKVTILNGAKAYTVEYLYATLAIDEAKDFDYFTLHGPADPANLVFTGNDFKWNGYYVLTKNINFTTEGYVHNILGTSGLSSMTFPENATIKDTDYGFTGTFDGCGYTIYNMKHKGAGGLFGIINAGTIKNVGFETPPVGKNQLGSTVTDYSILAYRSAYSAVIDNVYLNISGYTSSSQEGLVFCSLTSELKVSNSIIYFPNSRVASTHNYSFFGKYYTMPKFENTYFVSPKPMGLGTRYNGAQLYHKNQDGSNGDAFETRSVKAVTWDAEFVDGAYNTSKTYNYLIDPSSISISGDTDLTKYNVVSSDGKTKFNGPYTINTATGLKRYTNTTALKTYAEYNNFESWNPDIWTVVDGVPKLKSMITASAYSLYCNGRDITDSLDEQIEMFVGDDATISVTYGENDIVGKMQLSIAESDVVNGETVVSINGAKITANAKGNAVVKVTLGSASWLVPVFVDTAPIDYELEYQFSAFDGQFFDGNTVVPFADILANLTELGTIEEVIDHNGNPLEYDAENGVFLGMDLGAIDKEKGETWKNASIVLVGTDATYRLNAHAADAIIDEAKDLKVFTVEGDVFSGSKIVKEEGFVWDGYYVVVKDFDAFAQGYAHISASDEVDSPFNLTVDTVAESNIGLSGIFDGQGHKISNLQINAYRGAGQTGIGLFSFINGGIVRNINFYNISANISIGTITGVTTGSVANSGVLAGYLVNNAKIENIYLTYYGVANGSNARVLYNTATAGCEVKNSVIDYRSNFKVLTSTSGVHNANGGGLYESNAATFTNVYYISDLCLIVNGKAGSGTVVNHDTGVVQTIGDNVVNWRKVTAEAKYVDDVETTVIDYVLAATQGTQYHFDKYDIYTGTTLVFSKNDVDKETNELITTNDSYTVPTVAGIKRYTGLDTMAKNWTTYKDENDARRNDFSTWDTNVWTISSTGIPSMHVMTKA